MNTSGSGKTHIGLHGLCQYWGFYGVIQQASDGGSEDFWRLMSSLDTSRDYDTAKLLGIGDGGVLSDACGSQHMHQKAQHRVLQFVLARFLLLDLLITEASQSDGGLRPLDHRLLWILLQARPTDFLKEDAFLRLADALRITSAEDLKAQIEDKSNKLKPILRPGGRPLYFFLDEIFLFFFRVPLACTSELSLSPFRRFQKVPG